MRLFVVDGAPRATGYTHDLLLRFLAGARGAGAEIDLARLAELDVRPCRGCYRCWDFDHAGRCVQGDDMAGLLERFLAAEAMVLVTPVYYYSFSALMKAFIERLLPTTHPAPDKGENFALPRNAMRDPARGPRRAVLIAAGAHRDPRNAEGLVRSFELACEGFNARIAGKLVRTETHFLDFPASRPVTARKVQGAFESAGRELCAEGRVSAETEAAAALPLTHDQESFDDRFRSYWEIARELRAHAHERERLKSAASRDVRILVPELASCLDPQAAAGLDCVIGLELAGAVVPAWHLVVRDGRARAVRGAHPEPRLTLQCAAELFVDICLQRTDARAAYAGGGLRVTGDRQLFLRFGRLFPPPAL